VETKVLALTATARLEVVTYGDPGGKPAVYLEYVEHASDYWWRNTTTSVEIDAQLAGKIVAFLKESLRGKESMQTDPAITEYIQWMRSEVASHQAEIADLERKIAEENEG